MTEYRVIHRGLGFHPKNKVRVEPYPYEIKPGHEGGEPGTGVRSVHRWIEEDQPDVVVCVQDLWNQWEYLHWIPRDLPTVGYFPTDTPNVKWSYALAAAAMTEAVPYTQFGAHETAVGIRDACDILLKGYAAQGYGDDTLVSWLEVPQKTTSLSLRIDRLAARQNPEAFTPIGHGIEPEKFFPVDRKLARTAWGLPQDAFIVLSVGTNQFRKRQDITIRAFAEFAETHPNAMLVLHCMGGDNGGWDLAQLARLYGVADKVLCTHWGLPEITDEQLCLLYNAADVHLNTGGGEGWGLTSVEAALCGIPQLVPDWSATKELWAFAGMLLPIKDYRFEPKAVNTAHAIVDASQTARRLSYLATHEEARLAMGEACRLRALSFPSWTAVGEMFRQRVGAALGASPTPALPLSVITDHRHGPLRSRLFDSSL